MAARFKVDSAGVVLHDRLRARLTIDQDGTLRINGQEIDCWVGSDNPITVEHHAVDFKSVTLTLLVESVSIATDDARITKEFSEVYRSNF